MQENLRLKNFSQVYLVLVPVVTTVLAFAVGHSSYKMYLPLWLINACIMVSAIWILGAFVIRKTETAKTELAVMALFLVAPWIFISIFGGFGPPPSTMAGWVALATEQQVRFNILIASGISVAIGLSLLREQLKSAGENFFLTYWFYLYHYWHTIVYNKYVFLGKLFNSSVSNICCYSRSKKIRLVPRHNTSLLFFGYCGS